MNVDRKMLAGLNSNKTTGAPTLGGNTLLLHGRRLVVILNTVMRNHPNRQEPQTPTEHTPSPSKTSYQARTFKGGPWFS